MCASVYASCTLCLPALHALLCANVYAYVLGFVFWFCVLVLCFSFVFFVLCLVLCLVLCFGFADNVFSLKSSAPRYRSVKYLQNVLYGMANDWLV